MVTRRGVLASLSSATFLTGCGSLGGSSTTLTDSESTPTASEPSLSYIARVHSQATDSQPLTIEVGLRNTSTREVSIAATGRGNPFEELDEFTNSKDELIAIPPDNNRVSVEGIAQTPVDGCWRFVDTDGDQARVAAVSTAFPVSIPASDQYSVQHYVYEANTGGPCFPAGEYTSQLDVLTGGQQGEPAAELVYTLSIDEAKQATMSVDAKEPV